MVFSSVVFIFFFLPCCILGYYCIAKTRIQKNHWLLICSLAFYAWGGVAHLLIMLASIIVNWFVARKLVRKGQNRSLALFAAGLSFNIGLLFVFKYLPFTVSNINRLFRAGLSVPTIALPIGISFFTFQSMSYLIDVYRGTAKALGKVSEVGLYISLFPQLIAGPIVRFSDIEKEIHFREESFDLFFEGVTRFVFGLGKKAIIANTIAMIAKDAFGGGYLNSALYAWMGAVAYTLQIYFDFSGYSDMAIGLGKMFGFHFRENFDEPYTSRSVSEFWRRWHISMGTWFRDYLYIPLGGSRGTAARTYLNLLIVWMLTGLWHGANWTFVLWGLLQFAAIALEKAVAGRKQIAGRSGRVGNCLGHLYTLLVVSLGWVLFNSDSIANGVKYIGHMFTGQIFTPVALDALRENWVIFVCAIVFCIPMTKIRGRMSPAMQAIVTGLVFVVSVCYILKSAYNPFIYFNF